MWGNGDPRLTPTRAGIDAQRALDLAARIGELAHAREELRLLATFECDGVILDLLLELRADLHDEMEALRADPCGVLGRVRTQGERRR